MEARSRSYDSPFILSEEGLVSVCIIVIWTTIDVLGEWCLTHSIEDATEFFGVAIVEEAKGTSTGGGIINDFRYKFVILAEIEFVTDPDLACRVNDDIP